MADHAYEAPENRHLSPESEPDPEAIAAEAAQALEAAAREIEVERHVFDDDDSLTHILTRHGDAIGAATVYPSEEGVIDIEVIGAAEDNLDASYLALVRGLIAENPNLRLINGAMCEHNMTPSATKMARLLPPGWFTEYTADDGEVLTYDSDIVTWLDEDSIGHNFRRMAAVE